MTFFKMDERFKLAPKYVIDYHDFGTFVQEVYGLRDRFDILETPNDSTHSYSGIDGKMSEYEETQLAEMIKDGCGEYYRLADILNDLCRKGKIVPGDYLIDVCW